MDISRNLISVEFSGISKLVESNRFPRFQFRARVAYYGASLHAIRGSKQKLKIILIDNYFI